MPTPRISWWVRRPSSSAAGSSRPSTPSCRAGSPPTGRSRPAYVGRDLTWAAVEGSAGPRLTATGQPVSRATRNNAARTTPAPPRRSPGPAGPTASRSRHARPEARAGPPASGRRPQRGVASGRRSRPRRPSAAPPRPGPGPVPPARPEEHAHQVEEEQPVDAAAPHFGVSVGPRAQPGPRVHVLPNRDPDPVRICPDPADAHEDGERGDPGGESDPRRSIGDGQWDRIPPASPTARGSMASGSRRRSRAIAASQSRRSASRVLGHDASRSVRTAASPTTVPSGIAETRSHMNRRPVNQRS